MSQFWQGVTTGSLPPSVAIQYTADDATIAVPALGNLNVFSNATTNNNDHGIQSTASGSTVFYQLTNRQTGTVNTTDATLTTIISFALGATPGTYYVFGNLQAFNASNPAGGAYSFSAGYITDGVNGIELGIEFRDQFEQVALVTSDIFLSVSGNNVLVQVQGVAGLSIDWNALLEYRRVF